MSKTGEFHVARDLMVLGGGIQLVGEDAFELGVPSHLRADAAGDYYQKHLVGSKAIVICTGGVSPLYQDRELISNDQSEGELMAEYLERNWNVPESALRVETDSDTTTMNVVNSTRLGYLDPAAYGVDWPLAVVTHSNHYRRVLADLADAGFAKNSSINVSPLESDSAMREMISRGIRAVFFTGVRIGDLEEMTRRNERLVDTVNRLGNLGGSALKSSNVIRHSSS